LKQLTVNNTKHTPANAVFLPGEPDQKMTVLFLQLSGHLSSLYLLFTAINRFPIYHFLFGG